MKTIIVLLLLAALVGAGVWIELAKRHQRLAAEAEQAHAEAIAALRAEMEEFAAEASRARQTAERAAAPSAPPVTVVTGRSPAEALRELQQLRPAPGPKGRDARFRIVHQLENLVDAGPAAVPVIREFLDRMEDVDYTEAESRSGDEGRARNPALGAWQNRSRVSLDFDFPPSLRLGLVDVLRRIGGADAEAALATMLAHTGRGVEVAYVARALDEMNPVVHRPAAIAAAHELLLNPPAIERPNRLDENARAYLLNLLSSWGDTSFAQYAPSLLIGGDGRIDRTVLDYLNGALKVQAMDAIYQAYLDPRITNQWEKAPLVGTAFNYVGPSPEANRMFQDVLTNQTLPTPLKALAIGALAGADRGGVRIETPTDPGTIEARIAVLEATRANLTDPSLARAADRTIENLTALRDGRPTRELELDLRQWWRPGGAQTTTPGTGGP
jgi:hypothetical protein